MQYSINCRGRRPRRPDGKYDLDGHIFRTISMKRMIWVHGGPKSFRAVQWPAPTGDTFKLHFNALEWAPRLGRPLSSAAVVAVAAAAIVVPVAATAAAEGVAAVAEQQDQNDDPPPVIVQAAAQTVVIATHRNTSR